MAEYSKLAKGSFTATATSKFINLPFIPDYIELWNYTNIKTAGTNSVTRAWWDNRLTDGTANPTMVQLYAGSSSSSVFDTIQSNGISSFSANSIQGNFGTAQQIVGITKASQAVVNVTAHGYSVGDTIVLSGLYQSATTGMPQIAGLFFTITAVGDADHFTINWNTNQSNYTALSGSPAGSFVSKVLFPYIYVPQINTPATITTGVQTTVSTTFNHNFEVGQLVAFHVNPSFGIVEINSLPNNLIPGSPTYGVVTSITDNLTFVCNINSLGFTAYNTNQTVASVPGLTWPTVAAAGDLNTGGNLITSTSSLYPPPSFPTSTNRIPTINGPAIRGAFVNNSSMGFQIGPGLCAVATTARIMASTNVIVWHAYAHDMTLP
jgi:hypothetical protein